MPVKLWPCFRRGRAVLGSIRQKRRLKAESACWFIDPARPVLPVYIRVKNYRYRFLRKKEVIIGEPIRYEEFGFVSGGKEEYARAARLVFDRILALREREIDR